MNKKIKVAMVTNHLEVTGISAVIMNYCKELDKEKYVLTIIAGSPIADCFKKECVRYGIHMVELPSRRQESIAHYRKMFFAFRKGGFDIVHVHGNSSIMAIELTIAKIAGIKARIAHSHNSVCPNMKIHKLLNSYFQKTYTKALACGLLAGEWLFGKGNFEVLPNGFKTEQFAFSRADRESVRKRLRIDDCFVIGHIGRFNYQKNQQYLLKTFEDIAEKNGKAVLLLIGDGPDYAKVKALVDAHPYKDSIILYGETTNAAEIYSAMDVFAFPSRFEGLPIVLLEAQISGLPCVVSDKVTKEINFGDIRWQSIEDEPDKWAENILSIIPLSDEQREEYRIKHSMQIAEYDIAQSVRQLDEIYMNLIKG